MLLLTKKELKNRPVKTEKRKGDTMKKTQINVIKLMIVAIGCIQAQQTLTSDDGDQNPVANAIAAGSAAPVASSVAANANNPVAASIAAVTSAVSAALAAGATNAQINGAVAAGGLAATAKNKKKKKK